MTMHLESGDELTVDPALTRTLLCRYLHLDSSMYAGQCLLEGVLSGVLKPIPLYLSLYRRHRSPSLSLQLKDEAVELASSVH